MEKKKNFLEENTVGKFYKNQLLCICAALNDAQKNANFIHNVFHPNKIRMFLN